VYMRESGVCGCVKGGREECVRRGFIGCSGGTLWRYHVK
jgi:hypothetical protein